MTINQKISKQLPLPNQIGTREREAIKAAITTNQNQWNELWSALFDEAGIAGGHFNTRLRNYLESVGITRGPLQKMLKEAWDTLNVIEAGVSASLIPDIVEFPGSVTYLGWGAFSFGDYIGNKSFPLPSNPNAVLNGIGTGEFFGPPGPEPLNFGLTIGHQNGTLESNLVLSYITVGPHTIYDLPLKTSGLGDTTPDLTVFSVETGDDPMVATIEAYLQDNLGVPVPVEIGEVVEAVSASLIPGTATVPGFYDYVGWSNFPDPNFGDYTGDTNLSLPNNPITELQQISVGSLIFAGETLRLGIVVTHTDGVAESGIELEYITIGPHTINNIPILPPSIPNDPTDETHFGVVVADEPLVTTLDTYLRANVGVSVPIEIGEVVAV